MGYSFVLVMKEVNSWKRIKSYSFKFW